MKALCMAVIGILGILVSACVTGDEITSYVIEPDGTGDSQRSKSLDPGSFWPGKGGRDD